MRYTKPRILGEIDWSTENLVEASAGTGKTFLIEHAVADRLIETETTIDRILVVTFTEKAAHELRVRIRRLLERILDPSHNSGDDNAPYWNITTEVRAKLESAVRGIASAPIHTIHGFCYRLLQDYSFSSGQPLDVSQADGNSLFDLAFSSALRQDFAADQDLLPWLRAWRRHKSTEQLRTLLFRCLQLRGELTPAVNDLALRRVAKACAQPVFEEALDTIVNAAVQCGLNKRSVGKVHRLLTQLWECVADWQATDELPTLLAALEFAERDMLSYLAKALGNLNEPSPALASLTDVLSELQLGVLPLSAVVADKFLPVLKSHLQTLKEERGEIAFQDMLELVAAGLTSASGETLRTHIRGQYDLVLVDEFQDTDDIQWGIFSDLFQGVDGVTLCLVGDPKQAIYSFRGADLQTYFDAKDSVENAGGNIVHLVDNYRFGPDLCQSLNHLFVDGVDPFFDGKVSYPTSAVAKASRALFVAGEPTSAVDIAVVAPEDDNNRLSASAIRHQLLEFIGSECRRLLDDDATLLREDNVDRPISAADIFILTRTTAESDMVAQALADVGLPTCVYRQEGLFQSREAWEVLDVLASLAQPEDVGLRVRAMRTRFIGIELGDIGDGMAAHETLSQWAEIANERPFYELLAAIKNDTNIMARLAKRDGGERSITNLLHIFEVLAEYVHSSGLGIVGIVTHLRRIMRDPDMMRTTNIQRLQGDTESIAVMTMHASKGLEAPIVFLFGGLGTPPPGGISLYHKGGKRCLEIGTPRPDIKTLVEAEQVQEGQRLLYVAMTRAMVRLYLPYIDPQFYRRPLGSYQGINRRLSGLARQLETGRDTSSAGSFALRQTSAPAALKLVPPPARVARTSPDRRRRAEGLYRQWRNERHGERIVSYSQIKEQLATHGGPSLPEIDSEEPGGADLGLFVHDILERLPLERMRDGDNVVDFDAFSTAQNNQRLFEQASHRYGVSEDKYRLGLELVYHTLTTPIVADGLMLPKLVDCTMQAREIDFLFHWKDGSSGYVRGIIDLLLVHEGSVYVLDYKTDRLGLYDSDTVRQHTEHKYLAQVGLYTEAVSRYLKSTGSELAFGGLIYLYVRGLAKSQGIDFVDEAQARAVASRTLDVLAGGPVP